MLKYVPALLVACRLLLAPVNVLVAYRGGLAGAWWIVTAIYAGLLSDVFDGIIARKAGVATARLRKFDSQTDRVFWVCAGWCAWVLHPEVIRANRLGIAAVLVLEAACYATSFVKFRRVPCTHAWLSKFWGLWLLAALTGLIGFGYGGVVLHVTIVVGLVSQLDVIAITLILREWTHDIPSCYHAWQLRQGRPIKRYKLFN